ncbi:MAG: HDIG domain-containing protein [Bacteroidales bacterium]|nr:HDIG domain-containing protein [Bacteroidales bacterium]
MMPRAGNFRYDYKKGSPWMYDELVTRFDFPVQKSAAEIEADKQQVIDSQIPYYQRDDHSKEAVLRAASSLQPAALSQVVKSALKSIYAKGLCDSLDRKVSVVVVQDHGKDVKKPASEVYGFTSARRMLRAQLVSQFGLEADSLYAAASLDRYLIPNLHYDLQRSQAELQRALDNIATTSGVIYSGDRIVSPGEIITAESQKILDSYQAEFNDNYGYEGNPVFLWIGNSLVALILVFLLFFVILYTNADIFDSPNRYLYLLTTFLLVNVCLFSVNMAGHPQWLYSVPFSLAAQFLMAFFRKRVVLPVYLISLFPLFFVHNGVELFLIWATAGIFNIFSFAYMSKGWRQFLNAICTFLVAAIVYMAIHLVSDGTLNYEYSNLGRLLLGSVLAVAAYPLIFLFERIFLLVSSNRLDDLCDTNAPLLQLLAHQAAGTYQHSLQVMNMAEMAARAIGADVSLTRAGALYHDVGKIQNPPCFVENQMAGNEDYHKGLPFEESAKEIIRHVTEGVTIAEKYGLPKVLINFIQTHHGTSTVGYFYGKYIENGGDAVLKGEFSYPGPKPHSVEETLVMICDSVEAASRTLRKFTDENIRSLVDSIVDGKISEGQFTESELSLMQLRIVKEEICDYLRQSHHARVIYPKIKN